MEMEHLWLLGILSGFLSVSQAIVNLQYWKNCILMILFQDVTWHLKHKVLDVYWLKVTSWLKELQEQKYEVISRVNRDQL